MTDEEIVKEQRNLTVSHSCTTYLSQGDPDQIFTEHQVCNIWVCNTTGLKANSDNRTPFVCKQSGPNSF